MQINAWHELYGVGPLRISIGDGFRVESLTFHFYGFSFSLEVFSTYNEHLLHHFVRNSICKIVSRVYRSNAINFQHAISFTCAKNVQHESFLICAISLSNDFK